MSDESKLAAALVANSAAPQQDYPGFDMWARINSVPMSNDYDMRGFYNALMANDPRAASAVNPNDGQMHFPDYWKRPNHQSFSTESKYYDPKTMPTTPSWAGGSLGNGGESWTLRRPSGQVVQAEAPWFKGGMK